MKRTVACLVIALSLGTVACAHSDVAQGGDGGGAGDAARGSGGDVVAPDTEPYVTGTVLAVSRNKPVTQDCVEPDPNADPDGSVSSNDPPVCDPNPTTLGSVALEDIVASVGQAVPILREANGGTYEPITFNAIAKGDAVSIWISGPIAESYPAQGAADFVVVKQ